MVDLHLKRAESSTNFNGWVGLSGAACGSVEETKIRMHQGPSCRPMSWEPHLKALHQSEKIFYLLQLHLKNNQKYEIQYFLFLTDHIHCSYTAQTIYIYIMQMSRH